MIVLEAHALVNAMNIDLEQLKRLMRSMRRYDLHELELAQGDERITLRRHPPPPVPPPAWAPAHPPEAPGAFPMPTGAREVGTGLSHAPGANAEPHAHATEDPSIVTITSPLVGTFYRSASPGARPFVEVGSTVRPGTIVCIIEAMKLMNEIESEVEGVVTEVLVENGKPVEFGEKLLRVRRAG